MLFTMCTLALLVYGGHTLYAKSSARRPTHEKNVASLMEFIRMAERGKRVAIAVDIHDVVAKRTNGDLKRFKKVKKKHKVIAGLGVYGARYAAYAVGLAKRPVLEAYVLDGNGTDRQALVELISPYNLNAPVFDSLRHLKESYNVKVVAFSNIGEESYDYFAAKYPIEFSIFDTRCIPHKGNNHAFKSDANAHHELYKMMRGLHDNEAVDGILYFDDKSSNIVRCTHVWSRQSPKRSYVWGFEFTTAQAFKQDLAEAYQRLGKTLPAH